MFHKHLVQNQPVMIRRLDNTGREYQGKIVGKSIDGLVDHYIVEILDPIPGYDWTHLSICETCLDPI